MSEFEKRYPAKKPDQEAMALARKRQDQLIKPPGSLGVLEETGIRLAGIYGSPHPRVGKKCLLIFAASHGIVREGVASAPGAYTALQTTYILHGQTGAAVLAKNAGADVRVIDIGIEEDVKEPGLIIEKVRRGTADFLHEPAMSRQEAVRAIEVGIGQAIKAAEDGYTVLGVGEMGIGNTSPTAAIAHVMFPEVPLEDLIGRGAGLTNEAFQHKVEVIRQALDLHQPDPEDPLDVLSKVGGLDIAGMTGCLIGAAHAGIPAVIDGVISMAAALLAVKLVPGCRDDLFASHASMEPAYHIMARALDFDPPFHAHMRLGEGSGTPMMFRLMEDACCVLNDMATFDEVGTSGDFIVDIREQDQ